MGDYNGSNPDTGKTENSARNTSTETQRTGDQTLARETLRWKAPTCQVRMRIIKTSLTAAACAGTRVT